MSRISLAVVAAIACVALAVPAAASAKDEAATAAAIGDGTPAETEWTFCANEGARCEFTGTQQVRYGANGQFTLPRTFTDGVDCSNAVFGDPVFGVVKQCQVTGGSQTKDEAATAAAIEVEPTASTTPTTSLCDQMLATSLERYAQLRQALDEAKANGDLVKMQALTAELNKVAETIADLNTKC
jgi:hypothetical protein